MGTCHKETSLFCNGLEGKFFILNKENRHYHLNATVPVAYGLIISPNVVSNSSGKINSVRGLTIKFANSSR
jgi:hypothetical protein